MKYRVKTTKEAIRIMRQLREWGIPFKYDRKAFVEAFRRENPELASRLEEKYPNIFERRK